MGQMSEKVDWSGLSKSLKSNNQIWLNMTFLLTWTKEENIFLYKNVKTKKKRKFFWKKNESLLMKSGKAHLKTNSECEICSILKILIITIELLKNSGQIMIFLKSIENLKEKCQP